MAEDYIMRQVNAVGRGFGNVLATALHLKRSNIDLGQLSYFEFTMLCDDFLQILIDLTPEQKVQFDIDDTTVTYYKQRFIEP